jgi:hypothetical protein
MSGKSTDAGDIESERQARMEHLYRLDKDFPNEFCDICKLIQVQRTSAAEAKAKSLERGKISKRYIWRFPLRLGPSGITEQTENEWTDDDIHLQLGEIVTRHRNRLETTSTLIGYAMVSGRQMSSLSR